MPEVPVSEVSRDSQLLEKANWERGTITAKKGWSPKIKPSDFHPKAHHRLLISGVLLILLLIGIYAAVGKFFPDLLKGLKNNVVQSSDFDLSVSVENIVFPSDYNKQTFLDNFKKAKAEINKDNRYQYVETNFVILLGVYFQTHNVDTRVELEKFRDWVKVNYPSKYESQKQLYDFSCLDNLCGQKSYPAKIQEIKAKIDSIESIDSAVKTTIGKNFETAAFVKSEVEQGQTYVNVLASLFSEYERTKDAKIVEVYQELSEFITSNYQGVRIPDAIKI